MILQKEIATIAEQSGVIKDVIDKDWVLGHFISAMFSIPYIKQNLIFKGGTCLRKCWFPDYRFSEDLDFTATSTSFEFQDHHLTKICEVVLSYAGIKTHVVSLKPIVFRDKQAGYEAIIKYWGADHSRNDTPPAPERWSTKIKIEVILYEQMIFDPIGKQLFHPYSDSLPAVGPTPCYTLEEVLSDKIRALIQRSYTAPRDYYDIWYLSDRVDGLNWDRIRNAFYKKMAFKGLTFTGVEQLINSKNENAVRRAWTNSLEHQVKRGTLPEFMEVKNYLSELFKTVFEQ